MIVQTTVTTVTTVLVAVSPQARASYLALYHIGRRAWSSCTPRSSAYHRSDFTGQGFSAPYDTDQPTRGPLGDTSSLGSPHVTPKALRQHLDQFVVDQDRAKIVLSVAIHEHHLRIQELQRLKQEQASLEAQARRRASARNPIEDANEFPDQELLVHPDDIPLFGNASTYYSTFSEDEASLDDGTHQPHIEKSNVLILGPTGVGKTLMCKTLAKTLGIPISMSDCTTFTQAGYVGDDVEQCVARLFSASGYDPEATEQGIIVLDEIDKIAGARLSYGKDVGGEGVQQALLKIIEGTTVQVQAKAERNAGRPGGVKRSPSSTDMYPNFMSMGSSKGEVFNICTDNILFICTGAFSNLHKIVLDRKSMGSMGFGASIRSSNAHAAADGVMLTGAEAAAFKKDAPFFDPQDSDSSSIFGTSRAKRTDKVNVLDHVQPADLQKYGMIPELIGRIPTVCAVSALDEEALVRVLTEPKNSLVRQEQHKSFLRNIELRFTSGALREIARKASTMGTGARGLRHVVDQLLLQAKYETPGSTVRHILITQDVARLQCPPLYFDRGQAAAFYAAHAQEEEQWERLVRSREEEAERSASLATRGSFEAYRNADGAGFLKP